jgi:transformation/transcription domain-associated protein
MRDEKEGMDLFASVWFEVNAHVFQETWTSKLEFFLEQSIHHPALLSIAQTLFENEYRSRQLVALALRYFCDRLDLLGQMEAKRAAVTLRFMKLAFGAVAQFTDVNESTLTKHVEKLVMGAFPLAAKYPESNNYFLLLKSLFRAIGGGQGKFELLYKDVLPLLPEMLESLSKMLAAAPLSSPRRDLLIELSLTVPVRLAHLLRFLHYLMKPLVYALQGSPELVTQGLRTLELMVDNLTAEFLDPALQPVLRELMEALAKHLKPVPAAPHQHSHTIIRILGKLGGRNRRLLERHPNMTFNPIVETAVFPLSLSGRSLNLNMSSYLDLGIRSLKDPELPNKTSGFEVLRACTLYLLSTVSMIPL